MQTLYTNPTVVRFDCDYKKASEVTKKAHVMQPLHTNPTVVRFDFYYKKASEGTNNAQEELESVHPPLLQTRAMFVLFYTIKLDSYLLLPQLSPSAAEGQLRRNLDFAQLRSGSSALLLPQLFPNDGSSVFQHTSATVVNSKQARVNPKQNHQQ